MREDELIRVLSWYELFYAIGMASGPGAPVIFSWVYLKVGKKYGILVEKFPSFLLTNFTSQHKEFFVMEMFSRFTFTLLISP